MTRRDLLRGLGIAAGALTLSPLLDLASIAPPVSTLPSVKGWIIRLSDNAEFGYSFRGFHSGDEKIVGQILFSGDLVQPPRQDYFLSRLSA